MGSKVTKIHYDIFGQAKGEISKVVFGFGKLRDCVRDRVGHGRLFDNNKIPIPILNIFIFAIK